MAELWLGIVIITFFVVACLLRFLLRKPHEVKAKIASFDGFSGHADKNELADYVKSLTGDIKQIFVVHGEENSSLAFADTLRQLKPSAEVTVPELNETFEV